MVLWIQKIMAVMRQKCVVKNVAQLGWILITSLAMTLVLNAERKETNTSWPSTKGKYIMKNKRKYQDGETVIIGGYEFIISGYHYPSMEYIVRRSDGLTTIIKEEDFNTVHIPPLIAIRSKL